MKKYLIGSCAFNEGDKVRRVIQKYNQYDIYDVVIIDDGSTDGSLRDIAPDIPVTIVRNGISMGAGFCIRQIFQFAREKGYEAVLFASGNDKDDPKDIQKLVDALENGFDFVQGSRYLPGGGTGGTPIYRKLATRFIHPWLFSMISGRKITDSTNGFRGVCLSFLSDQRLDIYQPWLDQYELEPYMFYKAIKLGYQVTEVPVTKIYPSKKEGYTKMKPFSGWWSILRPLIYLGLGIKK